jgi:hypothetical protein
MKHYLALIVLLAILSSCATRKHQAPVPLSPLPLKQDTALCSAIFPPENWQFVHSLNFSRADGRGTTVIGVTTLTENNLHTALLTVEGLTLFEADFFRDGEFEVHRAVPPFDNPNFAKGMMNDIRTIFRPPAGSLTFGSTTASQAVCRYTDNDGWITDVLPDFDDYRGDCWRIRRYSAEQDMKLAVTATSCLDTMSTFIPEHLELRSYGIAGYTIKMKLLSADRL